MDSQANCTLSGDGRGESGAINSKIQHHGLVEIDGDSPLSGAGTGPATPASLKNDNFSTSSPYWDPYRDPYQDDASFPAYSDSSIGSHTAFPNPHDTMNSPYDRPDSRDRTPPLHSNSLRNLSLSSSPNSSPHISEGQQDASFASILQEQHQQPQPATLISQSQPNSQPKFDVERPSLHHPSWPTQPSSLITPAHLSNLDTISLRNLHTQAILGPDSWARPKPQPVTLSLYLTTDTTSAARTDNIAQTFSYGLMAKAVIKKIEGQEFTSIDHLTSDLASLADDWPGETLRIVARAPKALLRTTEGLERELHLQRRTHKVTEEHPHHSIWHVLQHEWRIGGLRLSCIIGVNAHERLEKQDILLTIRVSGEHDKDGYSAQIREGGQMWRRLVRGICEVVEPSSFMTLEALVALVAKFCLQNFPFPRVIVGIEKPSALTFVEGAGVEITRDRAWLAG